MPEPTEPNEPHRAEPSPGDFEIGGPDDAGASTRHEADEPSGPFAESPSPAQPLNWRTLSADEAEQEWLALNEWVHWLRREFGLSAAIIPPYWHRHPELVWELSALHQRWLAAYDPYQDPSAPLVWMAEFATARQRLHDWVSISGTRLDRDRPTRQTSWPGEDVPPIEAESRITNREDDFVHFVLDDVERRRHAEAAFLRDQPTEP
ncbi:hypothetical protein [Jiangella alba]|uniref:DUF4913 domain-containing protein n=1 Tax=Jiangella alba TaxID=561176 RepID=A0A1H5MZD5_9ACTN|nr:hypothetical protein [Jiangella alba]SEE94684.1 hypothetical protein SAMN04488561_3569 [Jiangella alba]